jgi:hypothetical protein
VKCPFKHRERKIFDAAREDKQFCLQVGDDGDLHLKKNHEYYFQCQTQMFVCNATSCYFVVYTLVDFVCIPVLLDNSVTESITSRCKLFILEAVMPELIGKNLTTKTIVTPDIDKENVEPLSNFPICFCGGSNQNSRTVKCSSPDCVAKEYHVSCLMLQGKKRFPQGWNCDVCKKKKNARSLKEKRNQLSTINK